MLVTGGGCGTGVVSRVTEADDEAALRGELFLAGFGAGADSGGVAAEASRAVATVI